MVSVNQADTVKQLMSEGWEVVPAPDKLILGAPTVLQRVRGGVVDKITVIPDGEAIPDAKP